MKLLLAEIDRLRTRIEELEQENAELTQKGESLCCQNGNLLVQEHALKADLEAVETAILDFAKRGYAPAMNWVQQNKAKEKR